MRTLLSQATKALSRGKQQLVNDYSHLGRISLLRMGRRLCLLFA